MLALGLVAAILAAPAERPAPAPALSSTTSCPALALRLGPADAPLALTAYVDPFATTALGLWLELRRLAADHSGTLGVRIVPAPTAMVETVGDARILRLLLRASAHGREEAVLRLLDRDGRERLTPYTSPTKRGAGSTARTAASPSSASIKGVRGAHHN